MPKANRSNPAPITWQCPRPGEYEAATARGTLYVATVYRITGSARWAVMDGGGDRTRRGEVRSFPTLAAAQRAVERGVTA